MQVILDESPDFAIENGFIGLAFHSQLDLVFGIMF